MSRSTSKKSFQFRENCPLFSADQRFRVCAVAKGELDRSGAMRIHDRLAVRSSRFQVAVLKEQRHDVFIMEVHGDGHARGPNVIPYDYALVLQYLLRARARKRQRIAAGVFYGRDRMVLELNHDRATADLRQRALGQERRIS